ncbi:MAG: FecR family protein [Oscillospiraceae bacterium]|jgi:hypothetical protein|nr:FecR family protein [Oscillospiraceae bacterium]
MKTKTYLSRLLALVVALGIVVPALPAVAADSFAANSIRLESYTGTAAVKSASGKNITITSKLKLLNGYTVTTGAKSYAFISLDDSKAIKLDASSAVEVRKSGKQFEVILKSGNLFFDVAKPLEADETLNVRSSTLVIGIRGTAGWLKKVGENQTVAALLTGQVSMTANDPRTGAVATDTLNAGEVASSYIESAAGEHSGEGVGDDDARIVKEQIAVDVVPGFVAEAVKADPALQEKIAEAAVLPAALVQTIIVEADAKLIADEAKAEEIQLKAEASIGTTTDVVIPIVEATPTDTSTPTSTPSNSAGSSSSSGSSGSGGSDGLSDSEAKGDSGFNNNTPAGPTVSYSGGSGAGGTALVGDVLTAISSNFTGTVTYTWTSDVGSSTGTTYTVVGEDAGSSVNLAADDGAASTDISIIVPNPYVTISGTPAVGNSLTAVLHDYGSLTPLYYWRASTNGTDYSNIAGAESSAYTVTMTDIGKTIQLQVYSPVVGARLSSATAAVATPTLTGTVTIENSTDSGRPYLHIGDSLVADLSGFNVSGWYDYEWKSNGTVVSTANNTYTVSATDIGANITLTVSLAGYVGSVTSAAKTVDNLVAKIFDNSDNSEAVDNGIYNNTQLSAYLFHEHDATISYANRVDLPGTSCEWYRNSVSASTTDVYTPATTGGVVKVIITYPGKTYDSGDVAVSNTPGA